jgi:hypothetical protein
VQSEFALYGIIIAVLSIVQTVFGVGLLLLGTPTLLLLGVPFQKALWILLPASLAISSWQLGFDKGLKLSALREFAIWAVPTLIIGLLVVLTAGLTIKADLAVGALLIIGAVLRLSLPIRRSLLRWLQRHDSSALSGIGLVHGLTNMGGGLLSLYSSVRHTGKLDIRQHIALGYALFAFTQLLVLAMTSTTDFSMSFIYVSVGVASCSYLTVGRLTFSRLSSADYNVLFSLFEIGCGSTLIVRRLLAILR